MTRKLKKLFNDKKIPPSERSRIPILCDEKGIVWVPGFGVRDDGGKSALYVEISTNTTAEKRFYIPQQHKSKNNKKG